MTLKSIQWKSEVADTIILVKENLKNNFSGNRFYFLQSYYDGIFFYNEDTMKEKDTENSVRVLYAF